MILEMGYDNLYHSKITHTRAHITMDECTKCVHTVMIMSGLDKLLYMCCSGRKVQLTLLQPFKIYFLENMSDTSVHL
ncbi:hypothetical protein B7P43_G08879 [Cryptotermes secundus]|uniref:Uncharacterized protein n=1 Tax=Cryptotermes secundus TaxID=105785 RepID=A0A2J7R7Q2_9NEOP|nr:hypothetical protein B7P43_G08879 [Cryptotermes secundus]